LPELFLGLPHRLQRLVLLARVRGDAVPFRLELLDPGAQRLDLGARGVELLARFGVGRALGAQLGPHRVEGRDAPGRQDQRDEPGEARAPALR